MSSSALSKQPRPILKRVNTECSASSIPSPKVHFPPQVSLSSTFVAHSSSVYDRSPINFSQNNYEQHAHGSPTYEFNEGEMACDDDYDDGFTSSTPGNAWTKGNHAHPRMRVLGFDVQRNSPSSVNGKLSFNALMLQLS